MKCVFLDNASTTFASNEAVNAYVKYSAEEFYNPSAEYKQSIKISHDIQSARKYVIDRLGATKGTIIFTSGATESNNLAIRGSLREGSWEYVFSSGEHSSVFNVAKALSNENKIVKFIPLVSNGEIDYNYLKEVVNKKTRLVSLIFVSNETGAINNIKQAVEIIKSINKQTLIHIDAVQAFNKIPFSLKGLDIDFLSYSSHKFHGMKGNGGLYVKNPEILKPLIYGGGQEFSKRSGTENVAGIMSSIAVMKTIDIEKNLKKVQELKNEFVSLFKDKKDVSIFDIDSSPYILSMSFKGVNGETLMRALENDVIVGKGSACGAKTAGNRVLKAIGFDDDRIKSSIRISFDYNNTIEEIQFAGKKIYDTYKEIFNKVK